MKLNNKGQTLVLFVILIPIIILVLMVVIEISKVYEKKIKTANTIQEIITYGLKNNSDNVEEKINSLIENNINEIQEKSVFVSENEIRIKIKQKSTKIIGITIELQYEYKGIKDEEEIIVKEG